MANAPVRLFLVMAAMKFLCIDYRQTVRENNAKRKKKKRIRRKHIGTHASPGGVSCAVHLVKGGVGWVWQSPSVCCPPCNGGVCEKVINMTSASVEVFRLVKMDYESDSDLSLLQPARG